MDELLRDFVAETLESLDVLDAELVRFERDPADGPALDRIFRTIHTIKGTCGFLDLQRLERLSHAVESLISQFRSGITIRPDMIPLVLDAFDRVKFICAGLAREGREPAGDDHDLLGVLATSFGAEAGDKTRGMDPSAGAAFAPASALTALALNSVRVPVERLEQLMGLVSELVMVRNQLADAAQRGRPGAMKQPLQRLSAIAGELQDGVMRTRMQPIGLAWSNIARVVRDLSVELGKRIEVTTHGDDTEIDRQQLDVIRECLVHLIRNAADHGLESVERRLAAGKPATGSLRLSARQEGSHIVIEVADDGQGLDPAALRQRARQLGLISEETAARLGDGDAARLIFLTGFSTAGEVTQLSGRGVGLDVVKASVERAGGAIDLANRPGCGLTFTLKIPLTLAISSVLVVEAAGGRYGLPQLSVVEIVKAQREGDIRIETVGGAQTLRLRDRLTPLIDLSALFAPAAEGEARDSGLIALCQYGAQRVGLLVDALHHSEEIVEKPISAKLRDIPFFSGAAVLGDGSVMMTLDVGGFARLVAGKGEGRAEEEPFAPERQAHESTRLLVFRALGGREMLAPLAVVERLEEICSGMIEWIGPRAIVKHQGQLLPLHGIEAGEATPESLTLIVLTHRGVSAGFLAKEIIDVVDAALEPDGVEAGPLIQSSALIEGRAIGVLDVAALFKDRAIAPHGRSGGRPLAILHEPDDFLAAMYAPLLSGAGFSVHRAGDFASVRFALAKAPASTVAVLDFDHADDALTLAQQMRGAFGFAAPIMVGTATLAGAALQSAAHAAGVSRVIGKFERQALLSALRPTPVETERAA